MHDPSNPFADPAIVRVQAQQSAQASQPHLTFGYNNPEPNTNNETYDTKEDLYTSKPPPQQQQPAAPNATRLPNPSQRIPNFPPIPSSWTWLPVKPCFYFNIPEEIAPEYQNLVKYQYYFMIAYIDLMLLNFVGVIAYLILDYPNRVMHFLMALLLVPLFVFLIFLIQYFLFYRAVRLDDPNSYFWYLLNSVVAVINLVINIIGAHGSGWCGLITMIYSFDNAKGSFFLGFLSLLISFGLIAVLVKFVHTAYQGRMLYMMSKHRQLSNALSARHGITYAVSTTVPLP